MLKKATSVYKKSQFYQNTDCFQFYLKRCFPLIVVSSSVSPLLAAPEQPHPFITKLPSDLVSFFPLMEGEHSMVGDKQSS